MWPPIPFSSRLINFHDNFGALQTGNSDTLGTELLESLLKMAPTKEEEWKLREYKDDSPFKLGPAEKFLKAVLDIPFAFKRVDALLYIANFDSEVDYLRRSFSTLEVNLRIFYLFCSYVICMFAFVPLHRHGQNIWYLGM